MAKGISSAIESAIIKELYALGNEIATKARANASWSSTIPNAIEVGEVKNDVGRYSIDIKINTKKAPQAAAFEYGSGIHSQKSPGKYRIPKEGTGLAFFWDKVDETTPIGKKFRGILPDGRAGFTYVDHPGVVAKPYLKPALDSRRKITLKRLGLAFLKGYRSSVVKVTVIK